MSQTKRLAGQILSLGDGWAALGSNRLGVEPCRDRTASHDFGRWMRWRKDVSKLALVAIEGKVCGVDYSAASVAASRRTNRHGISNGRVEIHQASVSQLPFVDSTFDFVTAIETHYYWPDLGADMREILRVLKPGGKLVLIAEAYKRGRFPQPTGLAMKLLRASYLTANEHRDLLVTAGYAGVEIFEARRKGWICVVGRKSTNNDEQN